MAPASSLNNILRTTKLTHLQPLFEREALTDVPLLKSMGPSQLVRSLGEIGLKPAEATALTAALFPDIPWDEPLAKGSGSGSDDEWLIVGEDGQLAPCAEPPHKQASSSDEEDGLQLEANPAEDDDDDGPQLECNGDDTAAGDDDDDDDALTLEPNLGDDDDDDDDDLQLEENGDDDELQLEDQPDEGEEDELMLEDNGGDDGDGLCLEVNEEEDDDEDVQLEVNRSPDLRRAAEDEAAKKKKKSKRAIVYAQPIMHVPSLTLFCALRLRREEEEGCGRHCCRGRGRGLIVHILL